jgi:hypothetical protein
LDVAFWSLLGSIVGSAIGASVALIVERNRARAATDLALLERRIDRYRLALVTAKFAQLEMYVTMDRRYGEAKDGLAEAKRTPPDPGYEAVERFDEAYDRARAVAGDRVAEELDELKGRVDVARERFSATFGVDPSWKFGDNFCAPILEAAAVFEDVYRREIGLS